MASKQTTKLRSITNKHTKNHFIIQQEITPEKNKNNRKYSSLNANINYRKKTFYKQNPTQHQCEIPIELYLQMEQCTLKWLNNKMKTSGNNKSRSLFLFGGILLPKLFNLYISDIPTMWNSKLKLITYSNDFAIPYTSGHHPKPHVRLRYHPRTHVRLNCYFGMSSLAHVSPEYQQCGHAPSHYFSTIIYVVPYSLLRPPDYQHYRQVPRHRYVPPYPRKEMTLNEEGGVCHCRLSLPMKTCKPVSVLFKYGSFT